MPPASLSDLNFFKRKSFESMYFYQKQKKSDFEKVCSPVIFNYCELFASFENQNQHFLTTLTVLASKI